MTEPEKNQPESSGNPAKKKEGQTKPSRQDRLSGALRDNLRRRKQQSRNRKVDTNAD